MKITVEVPANLESQLGEVASRLNVSINDLATAAVRDLVTRPDEEFERAAARVLDKNRELYRRLA
jgi:predicted transcriptional regulator